MRRCLGLLALLLWAGPAAPQTEQPRGRSGASVVPCGGPVLDDRVAGVSAEGEIELASGRIARLADLRWPDEPNLRDAALAWLRERIGQSVAVRAGPADRWNRIPARVAPGDAASPMPDLARHLVRSGLALVDAGEAEGLCERSLLDIEAEARRERRGLWAGERLQPLPAARIEALRERIGTFTLVEGRVRSVGERESRTYLNFGPVWAEDFTVTIPKRSWAILTGDGLSATALRNRRVRVRGILEAWNGPALTLYAPDMLEILDREPARR